MSLYEIAQLFADSDVPHEIHFHDVHDNNIENYYAADKKQPTENHQIAVTVPQDVSDELLTVLKGDMSLYQDVVAKAKFIVCASDFRSVLRPVFEKHGFDIRHLNKQDFYSAYLPFLENYKNKKNVKTICHSSNL